MGEILLPLKIGDLVWFKPINPERLRLGFRLCFSIFSSNIFSDWLQQIPGESEWLFGHCSLYTSLQNNEWIQLFWQQKPSKEQNVRPSLYQLHHHVIRYFPIALTGFKKTTMKNSARLSARNWIKYILKKLLSNFTHWGLYTTQFIFKVLPCLQNFILFIQCLHLTGWESTLRTLALMIYIKSVYL